MKDVINSDELSLLRKSSVPESHSDVLFKDEEAGIEEYDDYIFIQGNRLNKPFLEKPVNAEDHEIYIHYSQNSPCGSGYSVLFRKTEKQCSQFIPTCN